MEFIWVGHLKYEDQFTTTGKKFSIQLCLYPDNLSVVLWRGYVWYSIFSTFDSLWTAFVKSTISLDLICLASIKPVSSLPYMTSHCTLCFSSSIFLEKIRQHPEYKLVSAGERAAIRRHLEATLPRAEAIKTKLTAKYEQEHQVWLAEKVRQVLRIMAVIVVVIWDWSDGVMDMYHLMEDCRALWIKVWFLRNVKADRGGFSRCCILLLLLMML